MASLKEHELSLIKNYVPHEAAEDVLYFMHSYRIHLKIKRERKAIYGDYRPAHNGKPHTISLNATLNTYHFLITFIHELAHLITFLNHGGKVLPHGKEWRQVFKTLLTTFLAKKVFPNDIEMALLKSINNLTASSCSDPDLFKALHRYNEKKGGHLLENLSVGDTFLTEKGEAFKILLKRRTRYECVQVLTGKKYLFPGIYEVYTD